MILLASSCSSQHKAAVYGTDKALLEKQRQEDFVDVQACLDFLKSAEESEDAAGKMW